MSFMILPAENLTEQAEDLNEAGKSYGRRFVWESSQGVFRNRCHSTEGERASNRVPETARLTSHRRTVTGPSRGAYSRPLLKVGNRASIRLITSASSWTRS